MPHPLEQKIAALRSRVRQVLLLYGLSWIVLALLAMVLVLGLADFVLRFEDTGIRIICTALVVAVLAWTAWRRLIEPLRVAFGDVALALKVERRFPGLNDRLASTLQFLHEPEEDPQAGSAQLRRAVIAQTTAEVEQLNLGSVLETRPARQVCMAAIGLCLVAALVAGIAPRSSSIALARLVNPLGSTTWPTLHHLQFENAIARISQGEPLTLTVVDAKGTRLPPDARLQIRYDQDGQPGNIETLALQLTDRGGIYRQDSVSRPFSYRALGGDSQPTPWVQLEVIEPPLVDSLAVRLIPPAYTGWPAEDSDKHLRALKGTRVQISGTATKPLSAVMLRLENNQEVPGRVLADGFGFELPADASRPFVIEQSGSYAIVLADREGFQGGSQTRYEVRAVTDQPPHVSVEQPGSSVFVTPDAVVPLRLRAKDDLAIHRIELIYLRSDRTDSGEETLLLFEGPTTVDPKLAARPIAERSLGDSQTVEYRWDLAKLELKPGAQITFHAVAADYSPQTGQSQPCRINIITPDELQERIAQRQTFILAELARVLKLQQESRSQVNSLEIQLQNVGRLEKPDVDHLQGAELTQRQVQRTLTDASEGIKSQIDSLLADLANNKVDSPEVERRMNGLLEEIDRLDKEHLTTIERELTAALKASQSRVDKPEDPADPAVGKSLTEAGENQDAVTSALERMLGDLSQWDSYRRFHREIGQMRNEQDDIARQTAELGRQTLSKETRDLTPQQQADLKKLGQRQQDLARRFDKIQQQMDGMRGELEKSDPLAAGVISDAVEQARQSGISQQMREAGRNVDQNQVGQAAQKQQAASEDLQELLDILANRSEHELGRLVKKLKEAEQELAGLLERQQGLRKKMADAAKNPNEEERRRELERLSKEQRQLQEEAERMARKLQRLQAEQAGRTAGRAGSKMSKAGEAGEQGDAGAAEQAAGDAEKDLEEAQQQLAQRRKQAEIDLALEQLAKIEDALKSMHGQQQEVIAETQRLEKIRIDQGKWTRGQALSVRDLARQQESLKEEAESLAKKLTAAEVFSLALRGATREMTRATELLDQRETGEPTVTAETNALRRFSQLLESLKPEKPEAGEEKQGDNGEGGQQGGQGDGIPSIAQLKMLKLMQQDVNERTKAMAERFAGKQQLTPEELAEFAALSQEQAELADMTMNLSKPAEKGDDDPEKLPDLKLDAKE